MIWRVTLVIIIIMYKFEWFKSYDLFTNELLMLYDFETIINE
jgi:hypothetical protein